MCICWTDHSEQFKGMLSVGHIDLSVMEPPTASQIEQETAWQPIETAPKDGTVFLGYKLGQFRECYKVPRDDCDMWCFGGVSGADDLFPNIKPTHWMPLPTPPKRSIEGV